MADKREVLKVLDLDASRIRTKIKARHAGHIEAAAKQAESVRKSIESRIRKEIEGIVKNLGGSIGKWCKVSFERHDDINLDPTRFPSVAKADSILKAANYSLARELSDFNAKVDAIRRRIQLYGVDKKAVADIESLEGR
jgi:hypothetical protein